MGKALLVTLLGLSVFAITVSGMAPAFAAKRTMAACQALAAERGFAGSGRAAKGKAQFIRGCMSGKQG